MDAGGVVVDSHGNGVKAVPYCHFHRGVGSIELRLLKGRYPLGASICAIYTLGPYEPCPEAVAVQGCVAEKSEGTFICACSVVFCCEHGDLPCLAQLLSYQARPGVPAWPYTGSHSLAVL